MHVALERVRNVGMLRGQMQEIVQVKLLMVISQDAHGYLLHNEPQNLRKCQDGLLTFPPTSPSICLLDDTHSIAHLLTELVLAVGVAL